MPNATGKATGVRVNGVQRHYRSNCFNGRNRMWVNDGEAITLGGIRPWEWAIKTAALTTNVVTLTTTAAHGLASGATVHVVTANNNDVYGGRYVLTGVPTATTMTYARTATNIPTADNGGRVRLIPTVASTGSALSGTYRCFVAPVNKNKPLPDGQYVMGNPSMISDEITVTKTGIAVSGIPATHPDSQVTHWAYFRNQTGNYDSFADDDTQDFWLVDYIAIGTTTYTDTKKDEDLPPIAVQFGNAIPPAFKVGKVFGGRLFGVGYDAITAGTATVNTNTVLVDLSTDLPADGIVGAKFQKDGDSAVYEIYEQISTTQIALDRPFSGTLSGSTYSIYNNNANVPFSQFDNFEAFGRDGRMNGLAVGGPGAVDPAIAAETLNGYLYIFTKNNIYRVYGKGINNTDVKITPDPVVEGLGAVGPDAVWREGRDLYFLSFKGPMMFNGENAIPIGGKLGRNWIDDLAPDQLGISAVGSDGRKVYFAVPETGKTENTLVWVYDIQTQTWWQELYTHPRFYFRDKNAAGEDVLFYAQGKFIVENEKGTNDGVPSGTTTGTVTTGTTTTSATCSAAAFYTTGSGLAERYAHFYRAGVLVGRRRITSNTATRLTWSASGAGGGNLTVAIGDVVYIGPIMWHWTTHGMVVPGMMKREQQVHLGFELQGEGTASTLVKTDIVNGVSASATQSFAVDRNHKTISINHRDKEYAMKIESRLPGADVAIRDITFETDQPEPER